jgi:hypothetical protein
MNQNEPSSEQPAPVSMGNDLYWFECQDPSGNILEIVGKK